MTEPARMRAALQEYIDAFNRGDADALAALFADDARIEDPVGGGTVVHGRADIDAFYQRAVRAVDRLELAAPIRTSHGSAAAMAFDIHLRSGDGTVVVRAIDVMRFDDAGRVIDMKAYHGPDDVA